MTCIAPSFSNSSSSAAIATIGLLMDGVTSLLRLNTTVVVYQNPSFKRFDSRKEFDIGETIRLTIEVCVHV